MNDDYFPQDRGYMPKKKYSSRVERQEMATESPKWCGDPDCRSIYHPARGREGPTFSRGYADIAIYLDEKTIYRCQSCYLETIYRAGKSQIQCAERSENRKVKA